MKEWHGGAFDDNRVKLKISDARSFLENTEEKFDCIFVDVSDPLLGSPSSPLFTKEFYQIIDNRLADDGIFVTQAGRICMHNIDYHSTIYRTISSVFKSVYSYSIFYPFFSEEWGFVLSSRSTNPTKFSSNNIQQVLQNRRLDNLKLYNGDIHSKIFTIPNYLINLIKSHEKISTDRSPLVVK